MRPILWLLLLAPLAFPAIRVRVTDSQGYAIPGARVTAAGASAATNRDGEAELPVNPPAEIEVCAPGFATGRPRAVTAELTVVVRPAPLHTTVEVVAASESLAPTGTAADIERDGARTVLDAVEALVPGAFVTRRGMMGYGIATGGTGGISIRGIGEQPNTGVLVVVDGRPDFQGLMGHPLPDFYSLSDAGSVTVTEGPASVLWGSNAMGGVVEVSPRRTPEGMSTRLTSSLGSYYTGQHRLAHGARFNRAFYTLTAGISHTGGERPSSAFRSQDGSLALGGDLSRVWKASVDARYGHFHVEDPGPVTAPLSGSYARVGRGGFSANLDNAAGRTWGYARVYSSLGNHWITDGFRSIDRSTGLRVDQHVSLAPHLTLEGGGDLVRYGGRARNVLARLDYGQHNFTSAAGFTRAAWEPSARFRLHSGVRYEHHSLFGAIAVPEAGATLALTSRYSVSAEIGRGYRNPTIRELYLFPAPNPALRPERLWNYQATFQARPAGSLTASATLFYADLSNLIVVTGRYPNLRSLNGGRALNRGVESMAAWRPARRLAVRSGYAWLHSTNLAPYVPVRKWNYAVEFDASRAFVHFGGVTAGERWADAAHTRRMPGYTSSIFRITVPLGPRWSLYSLVDNLFNRRYEVVPGYPMPGVNAAAGFTVSF